MAAIKSVARSASVAFAPTRSDLLATGTMAGAIDLAFSTSASLDLFNLDFSVPDQDLPTISSLPTSERFNRLSWGTTGVSTGDFPNGLIAGGLADGNIDIWDPAILIRNDGAEDEKPFLARLQKHSGPVRGLDFSGVALNFLASGGDDGELCIWDLEKPSSPSLFPPLKGGVSGVQDEVSYLSWNRKVGHILASASYSGAAVVWDLKRQKPVISLTDPMNRRRCSVLQWNPDLATQLIVASDDDRSPSLQVWDLRNSVSPMKELVGHTKGVLAMAWSPIDSAFLLTCAKDNRTLCWDVVSGEIVFELPVSSNWNFDVQWSPRVPGILSTSSFDGKVNIFNIEACSRFLPSEGVFGGTGSSEVCRAPKWLKRSVGVTFGFGGKVISFSPRRTSGATGPISEIRIHTVITEEDVITKSKEFEAAIADGEKATISNLCETKIQSLGSEEEKELWSFLKMKCESDFRTSLLSYLGFTTQQSQNSSIEKVFDNHVGPEADFLEKVNLNDGASDRNKEGGDHLSADQLDTSGDATDDGSEFFNNLDTPKGNTSPQLVSKHDKELIDGASDLRAEQQDAIEEDDIDRAIQHSLIAADYQGAVKRCLSANRMADALVLAHVGGTELWNKTLTLYLRSNQRPYRKVMSAIVAHDIRNLVEGRSLDSWKETLALLCSYAYEDDWPILCNTLAARLNTAGKIHAATLCYICAGNTERAAEMWSRGLCLDSRDLLFLQDLMEKTVAMALASGKKSVSASLSRLVASYAELLASQGLLQTAMNYLYLVPPDESSEDLVILQNRIYNSAKVSATGDRRIEAATIQAEAHEAIVPTPVAFDQSGYAVSQEPNCATDVTSFNTFPAYPQATAVYPPSSTQRQVMPAQSSVPYNQASGTQVFYPPQVNQQQIDDKSSQQPPSYCQSNAAYNHATGTQVLYPPQIQAQQVNTFVPTNPSFSNLNQFQGPSSSFLGVSGVANMQLYPPSSLASTAPQIRNIMLPGIAASSVTSTPPARGFLPVPPAVGPQQPTVITPSMQPQSPSTDSAVSQVPAPVLAPTIYSADTSNVAAELKPVIATLTKLFNETSEDLGGAKANPTKKREIDDNSKKLGSLYVKLNSGDISANVASKLIQLCQSLDVGDYSTALHIQVGLTTSDWDECSFWLAALKRMMKTRQSLR